MSIDIALLSKIIGGLLAASTASYGGWVAYDVNNPTFHRLITEQGWIWSPINGDMGTGQSFDESFTDAAKKIAGDWRCTKQLFNGLATPQTDTSKAEKDTSATGSDKGFDTPQKTTIQNSEWEEGKSVGCLVADLGHAPNNKRSGFIKWELALRNKNRGFIYTGFVSFNTIKGTGISETGKRAAATSLSVAFEVSKDTSNNNWKIGKGFTWSDMLINNSNSSGDSNDYIKVAFPNDSYVWKPENAKCENDTCFSSNDWVYQKWVGFWEEKSGGDKQPTDALFIGRASQSNQQNWEDKKYQHDVWQTPDFDFKNSNQAMGNSDNTQTSWSSSIGYWYDNDKSKWKEAKGGKGDNGYLQEIYKPWAKKKGTWTKAEGICYQSNSRHIETEESQRLLNFCYQKPETESTS